jgi:hypothetical protein
MLRVPVGGMEVGQVAAAATVGRAAGQPHRPQRPPVGAAVRAVTAGRAAPIADPTAGAALLAAVAAGISAFGRKLGEPAEGVLGPVQW